MLGYIRPYPPDLRLREYQYYRGVYCGLCRAMGRCTGQCSRLTLSYDFVFLALVRLALEGGNPQGEGKIAPIHFERRRCLPHPLRRRLSLEAGEVTDYVACAAAVLCLGKLEDDRADERGIKRFRATLALPAARRFCKRAERRYPGLGALIEPPMQRLADMERQGLSSADEPADAFGEVLGALFAYGFDEPRARIARHIGHRIGRWLYLVDAIDDFDEDVKRDRPNPLHRLYEQDGLDDQTRHDLQNALIHELSQAKAALDLIDIDEEQCGRELSALLSHMLTVALPEAAGRILFPQDKHLTKQESEYQ